MGGLPTLRRHLVRHSLARMDHTIGTRTDGLISEALAAFDQPVSTGAEIGTTHAARRIRR